MTKKQQPVPPPPQTESETNVVPVALPSTGSSTPPVPAADDHQVLGVRQTNVAPLPPLPPPPPRPVVRPNILPPLPPSRPPQAAGGGGGVGIGRGGRVIPLVGLGGAGGIQVGGSAEGSGAVHHEVGGERGPGGRPKRKATEIVAPAGVAPVCSVCRRDFGSWKALFGHMRSHPNREWRGAFPPPVAQKPAAEGDQGPPAGNQAAASAGSQGSGVAAGRLSIDLNRLQGQESTTASASSSSKVKDGASSTGFDLNKPPTSDDDTDSGDAAA
ncbi:Zinc finger, C2H [Parasponia andersonii]|uniref:Zinc finger, C2H n=1 Tax=Parasponia andersonii TaxID=3476 RepID=A0A2P5BMI5_PARAD|nr:Zinc finger, C2H [Parasponia andersonii]